MPLSHQACLRASARAGERVELRDSGRGGVPGLALRIGERTKTWCVMFRLKGRLRRKTLGCFPDIGLADAREQAAAVKALARKGIDPNGEAPPRRARDTFARVAEQYVALHVYRNKHRCAAEVERILRSVMPALGERLITEITRRDVLEVLDEITGRGAGVMANRTLAVIKRVCSWAVNRGILETSPVLSLRPPARERARERVLDADELAAVWRGAEALGWPFRDVTRLLILTAARASEVAGARWAEIDVTKAIWTKPSTRTKSAREQQLPLSGAALEIIENLPQIASRDGFLFPSRGKRGHASSFGDAKRKLDRLSDVSVWTWHDLRRSSASHMARLGVPLHVIAEILGHSPAALVGVTARYQKHRFEGEQRAALERWADHVLAIAEGRVGATVVSLR